MNKIIEIITTGDGSRSLINTEINETYHSTHGAVQESRHVFIEKGLRFLLQQHRELVRLLEIGFGTGLNAILTLEYAERSKQKIHYTTIDNFPLTPDIWQQLDFKISKGTYFERLHSTSWNESNSITPYFDLHKVQNRIQETELDSESFDIVYFDAFAPNKQPEMWEQPILEKMFRSLKPGGVFVTYCAKGQVKRDLKTAGFIVEMLEGPPGKREMIRAIKP